MAPFNRDRRRLARAPEHLGWPRPGPRRALHGYADSGPPQSAPLRASYQRLLAAGKPPKVALTACLRKLLVLCNTLCQKQTMWGPLHALTLDTPTQLLSAHSFLTPRHPGVFSRDPAAPNKPAARSFPW